MERAIAFELGNLPFHRSSAVGKREGGLKGRELLLQTTCEISDFTHYTLGTQEQPCFQGIGSSSFDQCDQLVRSVLCPIDL